MTLRKIGVPDYSKIDLSSICVGDLIDEIIEKGYG